MPSTLERKATKAETDVQRHEAAIHELMLSLVHNLRQLPKLQRIVKAAECAARLERVGQ